MQRTRIGRIMETRARWWLQRQGLDHLTSNFHCRYGELDLVMRDGNCIVIVEVRYRRYASFGGGLLSVTRTKRERLLRSTQCFLQKRPELRSYGLRFDVIAMSGSLLKPSIEWCRHAFVSTD